MASYLEQLVKPDLAGGTSPADIINGIAFPVDNQFNKFQSDATGSADDPQHRLPRASNKMLRIPWRPMKFSQD